MTILAKFRGSHGVSLSTYGGDVESAVTDRGPHDKAPAPTPAAPVALLSEVPFAEAEATRGKIDEDLLGARRALEAAKLLQVTSVQAYKASGADADFAQVEAADRAVRKAGLDVERFESKATEHHPKWLRARIDLLTAEEALHRATAAERQREANEFGTARKEAERQESEAIHGVFEASQRASACATTASELRRELAKL